MLKTNTDKFAAALDNANRSIDGAGMAYPAFFDMDYRTACLYLMNNVSGVIERCRVCHNESNWLTIAIGHSAHGDKFSVGAATFTQKREQAEKTYETDTLNEITVAKFLDFDSIGVFLIKLTPYKDNGKTKVLRTIEKYQRFWM